MSNITEYYYAYNHNQWLLFATTIGKQLTINKELVSHPLSGPQQSQTPETIEGYKTQTIVIDNLRLLGAKRPKLFSSKKELDFSKAITAFKSERNNWRSQLLHFEAAIDYQSDLPELLARFQAIGNMGELLVGLFCRKADCFIFETPNSDIAYEKRTFMISKEKNPEDFEKLINSNGLINNYAVPVSNQNKVYTAYKLKDSNSILAIALINTTPPNTPCPFADTQDYIDVLSRLLGNIRSRRLHLGHKLVEDLFQEDKLVNLSILQKRDEKYLSGMRLEWIDNVCNLIKQYMNVDACSVFFKHNNENLALQGSTHSKKTNQTLYPISTPSLTVDCYKYGKPVLILDADSNPRNSHVFDENIQGDHKSWLGHPIKTKGNKTIGVLRLLNKRTSSNKLTYFCGSDIANARLASTYLAKCYEELRQYSTIIQEKKRALLMRDMAEIAENRTNRFMKSLTHEIQRPIPSIGGLLEYLETLFENVEIDNKDSLLLKIGDCFTCLDLLQVIIDTIAHRQGQIQPKYDEVRLVQGLLEPLKRMLNKAAADENKKLKYFDYSTMSWITIDKTLTTQILVILLLNAFKYAKDHSEVILSVRNSGDGIEFEVENEGEVIPAKFVDEIFEWEFRAPEVIAKKYPGAGIGLSLAQDIAKAMDTRIYVKSRTPTTKFAFTIKNRGL